MRVRTVVRVGVPNHRMGVGDRVVEGVRVGFHRVIRVRVLSPPCGRIRDAGERDQHRGNEQPPRRQRGGGK